MTRSIVMVEDILSREMTCGIVAAAMLLQVFRTAGRLSFGKVTLTGMLAANIKRRRYGIQGTPHYGNRRATDAARHMPPRRRWLRQPPSHAFCSRHAAAVSYVNTPCRHDFGHCHEGCHQPWVMVREQGYFGKYYAARRHRRRHCHYIHHQLFIGVSGRFFIYREVVVTVSRPIFLPPLH